MNESSVAPGIIFRNMSALNVNNKNNQQMQMTYVLYNIIMLIYMCIIPNVFMHVHTHV